MLNFIQLNHSQYTIYSFKVNATAFKKVYKGYTWLAESILFGKNMTKRSFIYQKKYLCSGMDVITNNRVLSKRFKKLYPVSIARFSSWIKGQL